jgi:hypothetical protein
MLRPAKDESPPVALPGPGRYDWAGSGRPRWPREEVGLNPVLWRLLLAANIMFIAGLSADQPRVAVVPPPRGAPESPDPQPEGYAYGMRGSHVLSASVISSLDITGDRAGEQSACVTVRKGPQYAATDPDRNGYEGCTLLNALAGDFFEDTDSAQVVICWKDRGGGSYAADNLADGPTLWRSGAAFWEWAEADSREAACVRFPLGTDAVELTVLVVYTDVLYAVSNDLGPEDGPAIMASWDARRIGGRWSIMQRNDVGVGCFPDMPYDQKMQVIREIREQIEARTGGRYSLQRRFNLGHPHPANRSRVIEFDSGFDIVPTPLGA